MTGAVNALNATSCERTPHWGGQFYLTEGMTYLNGLLYFFSKLEVTEVYIIQVYVHDCI